MPGKSKKGGGLQTEKYAFKMEDPSRKTRRIRKRIQKTREKSNNTNPYENPKKDERLHNKEMRLIDNLRASRAEDNSAFNLDPVPADKQKSVGKLPENVRNKMGFEMNPKNINKEGFKMAGNPTYQAMKLDPINEQRSKEYTEARSATVGFPGSTDFGIQGPFNEGYEDKGTGSFNVSYALGDKVNAPSEIKPKSSPKTNAASNTPATGSGGFGEVSLGNFDLKLPKLNKADLSGGKPNETQALTPREMRRNQRNVKFLKRRIRKGERKGDNMESTRQALGNAQAQQAGNFKPGQKFKTPAGTGSYVTPKQNREKNGSVIGNALKNTFGKKEGGSKVGNALRNAGGIFKKKTKSSKSFKGGMR